MIRKLRKPKLKQFKMNKSGRQIRRRQTKRLIPIRRKHSVLKRKMNNSTNSMAYSTIKTEQNSLWMEAKLKELIYGLVKALKCWHRSRLKLKFVLLLPKSMEPIQMKVFKKKKQEKRK